MHTTLLSLQIVLVSKIFHVCRVVKGS